MLKEGGGGQKIEKIVLRNNEQPLNEIYNNIMLLKQFENKKTIFKK